MRRLQRGVRALQMGLALHGTGLCARRCVGHTTLLAAPPRVSKVSPQRHKKPGKAPAQRKHDATGQPSQPSLPRAAPPAPPHVSSSQSPPAMRIEARERALLRYFGRSRAMQEAVPLRLACVSLQRATSEQAMAVQLATLFPTPVPADVKAGSSNAARTLNGQAQGCADGGTPQEMDQHASSTTTTISSSPPVAPALTNPFLGSGPHGFRQRDWADFCLLDQRYTSVHDSSKAFGAAEVVLEDIYANTTADWDVACDAWAEAMRAVCVESAKTATAVPVTPSQHRVCFLVCYAQTQQRQAVGRVLQRVAAQVCRLSRHQVPTTAAAAGVFRVRPILIGMHPTWPVRHHGNGNGDDAGDRFSFVAESTETTGPEERLLEDALIFATGGLYTAAATMQCLLRLPPHVVEVPGPASAASASPLSRLTLRPHVVVLSDSCRHPRTVADLLEAHIDDGAPLSTQPRLHVIPAIVSPHMSVKESDAVARYVWHHMQHVPNDTGGHSHSQR